MLGWFSIEQAPVETWVDLLIEGPDDTVDFYCPDAKKVRGKPLRRGRAAHWKKGQDGAWRTNCGLSYSLSPEVTPIGWLPVPVIPTT